MSISPPPSVPYIPPHHSSSGGSFPVIVLAVIGILATGFLLVGYYLFVIKCCLNWHRIDVLNRFSSRRRTSPVDSSPAQEGENKGLEEAIIRSIPVIKFRKLPEMDRENTSASSNRNNSRKGETASSYECAVCLSEFEDEERLRVIPNCCHAFHIDCIDVWLQSNANCPLCRSWISPSSVLCNDRLFLGGSSSSPSKENVGESDDEYVVIEIKDNNLDEPRLVSQNKNKHEHEHEHKHEQKDKKRVVSMGDEWIEMKREKDEEFRIVQPIRRSISMDLSTDREFCLEIQQCCRMKEISGSEITCSESSKDCSSSSSGGGNSGKIRRSIFSFGYYGRNNSRGSVQPVHLSP